MQILGDLLGDLRGADRAAVLLQIGDDRADDPRIVDAAMLKEGAVLRREESAHEQRRIFAVVELDAAFAGIAVDRLALAIPHEGGERRFIVATLVDRGQRRSEESRVGKECVRTYRSGWAPVN